MILPPPDRSCGPTACGWSWAWLGAATLWVGVTASRVTAIGGPVVNATKAIVGSLIAIGDAVKTVEDPPASLAGPAKVLGIPIVQRT